MKATRLTPSLLSISGAIVGGLVLVAGTAEAETIYTGTNFDIEVSSPLDVGITPLKAVTLTAVGKNGALPNTFDSDKSGTGGNGITTVGDSLHQVWEFGGVGVLQTPTNTLAGDVPPVPQELDSHFLVEAGEILDPIPPAENRPTSDPTEDPRAGFGNSLTGTFSLVGGAQTTWDFAYLVMPHGTEVFLDFELGAAGVDSEWVFGSFTVPEPGTLLLLVLGALGMLLRRRGLR